MTRETLPDVATLVDLDRYPLDDLQGRRGAEKLAAWRAQLSRTGACNLPEFLTPQAVTTLCDEVEAMLPAAYRRTFTANFLYRDQAEPDLPLSHPQNRFWTTSSIHLASDQFAPSSKLRRLYEWDRLTELVAGIQGKEKLYRDGDEFQALNVIALEDGDRTVYHHDQVDCVVTLLLQAPFDGGDFVFRANTRNEHGELDLDAIRKVVSEEPGSVEKLDRRAGTLTFFRGGYSLHGVTPVRGARKRISAVLSYDVKPVRTAPQASNIRNYGPRVERILAERRSQS